MWYRDVLICSKEDIISWFKETLQRKRGKVSEDPVIFIADFLEDHGCQIVYVTDFRMLFVGEYDDLYWKKGPNKSAFKELGRYLYNDLDYLRIMYMMRHVIKDKRDKY